MGVGASMVVALVHDLELHVQVAARPGDPEPTRAGLPPAVQAGPSVYPGAGDAGSASRIQGGGAVGTAGALTGGEVAAQRARH
eukprot:1159467-Pelagomonas_calceolata.AAC.16